MLNRKVSIKSRIFLGFTIFAIVLLAALWFFQIVYLDQFYKRIKRSETEIVMNDVERILKCEDDVAEDIESLAAGNNIAVYITDSDGNALYNAEFISNSQMSSLPNHMFQFFYSEAVKGGGEAIIEYKGSQMMERRKPSRNTTDDNAKSGVVTDEQQDNVAEGSTQEVLQEAANGNENETDQSTDNSRSIPYTIPPSPEGQFIQNIGNELAESMIYVRIVYIDNVEYVLMVNSVLTPVGATVSTLKLQLFIISILMAAIAIAIATYFSRSISKSIVVLNDGAKKLADGDYSVSFDSREYKEVSQLSDTLNYAASELGKTDALQKELIANVSHDLRTPLTMIKGYAEVMRDIPGENSPENIQVIIDETARLSGLVNDMLDISRLKAGTIVISPAEYNITESIRHVLQRYNKLHEVEGYNILFEYDEEIEIFADEQKMYQVIYNLVNNAINYTGEDKTVRVVQRVNDGILRIEVIDSGNGLAPEDIPYVWDRYYKDKTTHKRAIQGTGLGLSIVKSVLELHGARYGVASTQGQGATFWFEIPVSDQNNNIEE